MKKYGIKSYNIIEGESIGETMYPIDTIIESLQLYKIKYSGILSSLSAKTTIEEIVEEMIKKS